MSLQARRSNQRLLLSDIVAKFPAQRIVVIGDVMLDQYIWGSVTRISPEAPVPVIEVVSESFRLGGAANVAANIRSLGGQVTLISVIGEDENGARLRRMLLEDGTDVDGLLVHKNRPTTLKTRVIAQHQQLVRIDRETRQEISDDISRDMLRYAEASIPSANSVVVSDYDKGVITKEVLTGIFDCAQRFDKPVIVDPKMRNFWRYTGATVVTPNQKEASQASGREIADEESLLLAGQELIRRLEIPAVLITRGEHGMSLLERRTLTNPDLKEVKVTHIPAVAREVFDVTGAGDTVVASFSLALAAGLSMVNAAKLANFAAGIVVGKLGTATVTPTELAEVL